MLSVGQSLNGSRYWRSVECSACKGSGLAAAAMAEHAVAQMGCGHRKGSGAAGVYGLLGESEQNHSRSGKD